MRNKGSIPIPLLVIIDLVILSWAFMLLYQHNINSRIPSYEVKGTMSLTDYLGNQIPGREVRLVGIVKGLNELRCPCFSLTSGNDSLIVWHGFIEAPEDETHSVSVDVTKIKNGDEVLVTGALNERYGNFELKEIKKITE